MGRGGGGKKGLIWGYLGVRGGSLGCPPPLRTHLQRVRVKVKALRSHCSNRARPSVRVAAAWLRVAAG